MLQKTTISHRLRRWLLWIVAVVALAACGGRSDTDAIAPKTDASADREAGSQADGADGSDVGVDQDADADADARDTSTDVRADVDAGDAFPDRRPDAPDAPSDVRVDARPDAGVDARPDAGFDASDGSMRTLVSIAVTPPFATIAIGTKLVLTVTGTYSDGTIADVTAMAAFTSLSPANASVAANVVTALAAGMAPVSARVGTFTATSSILVSSASIATIAVTPPNPTTGIGGSVSFTAVATLTDGITQDVTASVTWTSDTAAVATIASTGVARALSAGTTTIRATLGATSGTASLTVRPGVLVSISVTPASPIVPVAVSIPFRATGSYSDGTFADLTDVAVWSSSNPETVSIASTGVGTALSPGTSTIAASVGQIRGTSTVVVTQATLQSITVTPAMSTLAVKSTTQLKATGTYSDMTTADITASVTWSATTPTVASVSNVTGSKGQATALSAGTTLVVAVLGNVRGAAQVTVQGGTLVRIDITPANATVPISTTMALRAQGTYTDGSSIDITTSVTWSTSSANIASISNAAGSKGRVTGLAVGTTQATALLDGVTGTTPITVTAATLVSITVTPTDPGLVIGQRISLTATGVFSDMSRVDLTSSAIWTSDDPSIATVSNVPGAEGQLTATGAGGTFVYAHVGTVSGSIFASVRAPQITQLVVSPPDPTNRVGQTRQFAAIAIFSNGSQQNVTARATWSSNNNGIAAITAGGLGTARSAGVATITAGFQGLTGTTRWTVTDAVPVSISVTPFAQTVAAGTNVAYQATAIFSDNTTQNVTNQATWTSTNPMVAAISTAGPMRGTARARSPGVTTIQASWQGLFGSTSLTVTDAVPVSISVSPASVTVAAGSVVQFTATVLYSDDTSRPVTGMATWISTNPMVAQVSTAGMTRGQATAFSSGTTSIQATFAGLTGSATLTVSSATLVRIQVTPFSPTLPVGFVTPFAATGVYSDNSIRDLTTLATWISSDESLAAVSNAAATKGQVTPLGAGPVTLTATYQGVTGTDSLTVTGATLSSIAVAPANATIAQQASVQYVATGTFSDASQLDVTSYVTWISSDAAIADVSNATGSIGLAKGSTTGTVTISARRGMVTGSTSLFVQ